MSACSWVRLTATLSTPGRLPSAFSIVPVHNEQCSPPMWARIRRRPGSLDGSSLQKCGAASTAVAALIIFGPFSFLWLTLRLVAESKVKGKNGCANTFLRPPHSFGIRLVTSCSNSGHAAVDAQRGTFRHVAQALVGTVVARLRALHAVIDTGFKAGP